MLLRCVIILVSVAFVWADYADVDIEQDLPSDNVGFWERLGTSYPDEFHIFVFGNTLSSIGLNLKQHFEEETDVVVIEESLQTANASLVHLSPVPVDLTCLLPPPIEPSRTWKVYEGTHDEDSILQWMNSAAHTFRTDEGRLSATGLRIRQATHALYSLENTPRYTECDRITLEEASAGFVKHYLVPQKPVIITDYHAKATSESVLDTLTKHGDKKVGVKLADSSEFEGVEPVTKRWGDLDELQTIPPAVLDKLQSPDLVVIRAAHRDMSLEAYLRLLQKTRASIANNSPNNVSTSGSTAYVEYQSLTQYPDLIDDLLMTNDQADDLSTKEDRHLPPWMREVLLGAKAHLWLGDGRTVGKLHFDPFDNVLHQVRIADLIYHGNHCSMSHLYHPMLDS